MAITSGLRAAFFAFVLCLGLPAGASPALADAQASARAMSLAVDPAWHALLHLRDGQPQIRDRQFILTLDDFSPARELNATLAWLMGPDAALAACRFPARHAWLRAHLALPPLSDAHCEDWQEFQRKAPMDHVALVFAAEVLSQPSSMMGHLFLKADGRTAQGRQVDHAISFFTDAGSWNLPKLFYDSMVAGKQGYFILAPYREERERYAVREQRPLWQLDLALTAAERQLLQAHIHELRQTQLTYYFQSYNCATLIEHLVAVARPEMIGGPGGWTTPREVLHRAQDIGLIQATSVQTPSRWLIRSLSPLMPAARVDAVAHAVEAQSTAALQATDTGTPADDFLAWTLAEAYLAYRQDTGLVAPHAASTFKAALQDQSRARFAGLQLDADQQHLPTQAPPERQLAIGWVRRRGEDAVRIQALPVSHHLGDDNRAYLNESELRLFEPSLLLQPRSGRLNLERFTVYAVRSILPTDRLTGGLSGQMQIAWAPQASTRLPDQRTWLLEGALGQAWRVQDDVDAYALLGGGWGARHNGYLYAQPEVGLVVREVFNMKSWLRHQWLSRPLDQPQASRSWSWTQSLYLSPHQTWQLDWDRVVQGGAQRHTLSLSVKWLY
jgi:hypothetical protein